MNNTVKSLRRKAARKELPQLFPDKSEVVDRLMHDEPLLEFLKAWHGMGVAAQSRAQPDMVALVRGSSRTALKTLCELSYLQGFVGRDWQQSWEVLVREANRGKQQNNGESAQAPRS